MYRGGDDVFCFPADHAISTTCFVRNSRWRSAQRRAITRGFTHVVVESGRHLFGTEGTALAQISELRDAGVSVAMMWHGSDIRLPSLHAEMEPDSPFRDGRYVDTEALEAIAAAHARMIAASDCPQFVSTPDLLRFVPDAVWVPVVVEPSRWQRQTNEPALTHDRPPVVVHAPTRAGLKGSDRIVDAMRSLHDEGVIDYSELYGIPSARMPEVYGGADIVLDQFLAGSYGTAACEAMAAGRLVIGHVSDEVREAIREATGADLPIVQSRASELGDVMRRIVADRERFAARAATGPDFVRTVHDGDLSARAMAPFLTHSSRS